LDKKIKDIVLRDISKSFNGVNIISNLSLEISAGSKVAVTGKSGAGKSTLVNMLMGFILPDNGNITLLRMDVNEKNINEIRENLSWVPQELNIDVRYVRDLLLLPFDYNKNKNNNPSEKTIINALDIFGLKENILSKDVSEISGGEKQRIFLTSSSLLNRKMVILDEPASGLDSESKRKVINYFLNECVSTVVSVTHDQEWMDSSDINLDLNNNGVEGR
jgi:putative ABC transport system ATP-binding protein